MHAGETSAFPASPAATAWLTLDDARAAAIVRVLRGARGPGMIGHVPSLAVLFPSAIASGDPSLDASFAGATETIRGTYERLFVKLRIPGYGITSNDLEDAATRRELLALLERITSAGDAPRAVDANAEVYVPIDRDGLRSMRAVLADAPLGGPHALAAITSLLPRFGRGDAAAAVGAYASALASAFAAECTQPHDAFAAYLTAHVAPELDAARAVAVAVLDAHNELASP